MRIALSIVAALALAAGCRHGSEERRGRRHRQLTTRSLRQSLLAADAQLGEAIGRLGPAEGLSAQLVDDAAYLHPGAAVVTGRAAVQALLRSAYPDRSTMQVLHRVTGDASSDGEIGYSFGWFEEQGPPPVASGAAAPSSSVGTRQEGRRRAGSASIWRRGGARAARAAGGVRPRRRAREHRRRRRRTRRSSAGEHGAAQPGIARRCATRCSPPIGVRGPERRRWLHRGVHERW